MLSFKSGEPEKEAQDKVYASYKSKKKVISDQWNTTVMGWIVSPQKIGWGLNLIPMNVTLFRSRLFSDIIKVRWGHTEVQWVLLQCDCVLRKKRLRLREKVAMWQQRWGLESASISQGHHRLPASSQKLGRSKDVFHSWARHCFRIFEISQCQFKQCI